MKELFKNIGILHLKSKEDIKVCRKFFHTKNI